VRGGNCKYCGHYFEAKDWAEHHVKPGMGAWMIGASSICHKAIPIKPFLPESSSNWRLHEVPQKEEIIKQILKQIDEAEG